MVFIDTSCIHSRIHDHSFFLLFFFLLVFWFLVCLLGFLLISSLCTLRTLYRYLSANALTSLLLSFALSRDVLFFLALSRSLLVSLDRSWPLLISLLLS